MLDVQETLRRPIVLGKVDLAKYRGKVLKESSYPRQLISSTLRGMDS